jgi:small-conductance mechanosensitive channel
LDLASKVGKGLGIAAAFASLIPAVAIMSAAFGYFAGWLFAAVFSETWIAIHSWLQMPAELTGGMFGAFVSAFGGCFGKAVSTGK